MGLSKRRRIAAFTAAVRTREFSVSNHARVQLGSTPPRGRIRLPCLHVWVPWSVFCLHISISDALVAQLVPKFNLFTCYSFALLPRVFIPFAHQTAAIIRARWAGRAAGESNCRVRLLWNARRRLAVVSYCQTAYLCKTNNAAVLLRSTCAVIRKSMVCLFT